MVRRTLITDLTARQSALASVESCDGCAAPFSAFDRADLLPIEVGQRLPRIHQLYALRCSCGHVSVVFVSADGEIARVLDEWISPDQSSSIRH